MTFYKVVSAAIFWLTERWREIFSCCARFLLLCRSEYQCKSHSSLLLTSSLLVYGGQFIPTESLTLIEATHFGKATSLSEWNKNTLEMKYKYRYLRWEIVLFQCTWRHALNCMMMMTATATATTTTMKALPLSAGPYAWEPMRHLIMYACKWVNERVEWTKC